MEEDREDKVVCVFFFKGFVFIYYKVNEFLVLFFKFRKFKWFFFVLIFF